MLDFHHSWTMAVLLLFIIWVRIQEVAWLKQVQDIMGLANMVKIFYIANMAKMYLTQIFQLIDKSLVLTLVNTGNGV